MVDLKSIKAGLLSYAKPLLAVLSVLLFTFLYLTSLLSQTTTLSDSLVDFSIYLLFLLLVGDIAMMAYVIYLRSDVVESVQTPLTTVPSAQPLFEEVSQVVDVPKDEDVFVSARRVFGITERVGYEGFALVERSELASVGSFLRQQHPQIVALMLSMIEQTKAHVILESLKTTEKEAVLNALKESRSVTTEALRLLDAALQKEFTPLYTECTGLNALSDEEVREILRHIDKKELMFALKGATKELQEKFFANMSDNTSERIRHILKTTVKIDETKSYKAIKNLYLLAQRLRENGRIRTTNKAMG